MRRWLTPSLLLAATLLFSACGDRRTPVVVYSPHGRDLLLLVEQRYEELHPDVDVRWLDMGSQEVYDRVRSERANPQGDVWFGGPDTIFARGAKEGLLAAYRPSWGDAVPERSRGPGDLYFGVYRTPPVLVYNSDLLSAAEAPHDWDDLLDPRWKGRIVIRDPLASGTMRVIFGMILARSVARTGDEQAGWDWLRQLDASTSEYAQNPALFYEKLVRQEALVSAWNLTDILVQEKAGSPIGYTFPSSGTPVIDDAIGLINGAPHAAAAKAFIDWVGERDAVILAADKAFRLPTRTDLPAAALPDWAQRALREMVPANVDWKLMADKGAEWMAKWDRTVRGRGARGE
jgi:iron(III) transport system substrate-binding protein